MKTFEQAINESYDLLIESKLTTKEEIRTAIALWKKLSPGRKPSEAKRILKAAKKIGYIIKQQEILAYADQIEGYDDIKPSKAKRKEIRQEKKAKSEINVLDKLDKVKIDKKKPLIDSGLYADIMTMAKEQVEDINKISEKIDTFDKAFPEVKDIVDKGVRPLRMERNVDEFLTSKLFDTREELTGRIDSKKSYVLTETIKKINEFYKTELSNSDYLKMLGWDVVDIKDIDDVLDEVVGVINKVVTDNPNLLSAGEENVKKEFIAHLKDQHYSGDSEPRVLDKKIYIDTFSKRNTYGRKSPAEFAKNLLDVYNKVKGNDADEQNLKIYKNGKLELTFKDNKQALDFYNWVGFKK